MIINKKIDEAFEFYNIDCKYKYMCYKCAEEINNNVIYLNAFEKVYKRLYYNDFKDIKELWNVRDISKLFTENINPFITNIMVLLGHEIHDCNMKKYNFDDEQIQIQKKRIKECFENDLKNRGYDAIRISQMLWAMYFIRGRVIEIGSLQFEYESDDKIKIHIPRNTDFNILKIKNSIEKSKYEIKKIFGINNYIYICNSWLLSNQLYEIIDKNTNIFMFHELFDVQDGEDCITDILNFVYELAECKDYFLLPEITKLQKNIKAELLKGNKFCLGLGTLNTE